MHALQHASFVAIGVLVWWAALEPWRRRPPGALWKIGHILGARFADMFLGMSFVIIRVPIYTAAYGSGEREGLTAVADQQIAGAMMVMLEHRSSWSSRCASSSGARPGGRPRGGRRRRGAAAYFTVSLPSMPPWRWPGTEQ